MLKKYAVFLGVTVAIILLLVATLAYPGGSLFDKNSIGFDWTKNFISNLFGAKAVNGSENPARLWADFGMIMLSISFSIFFFNFSKKIPAKGAANIVKYLGIGNLLFTSLIVTQWHDLMVNIASTLFLVSLFYITVYIFKSKLHLFKVACVICLLIFYYTLYLYKAGYWDWLPIMQKITFISSILLILALEYFTKKEDFEHTKSAKQKA